MASGLVKALVIGVMSSAVLACSTAGTAPSQKAHSMQQSQRYVLHLEPSQEISALKLKTLTTARAEGVELDAKTQFLMAGARQALQAISETCFALNNQIIDEQSNSHQVGGVEVLIKPNSYQVQQIVDGLQVVMRADFNAFSGCEFKGDDSLLANQDLVVKGRVESDDLLLLIKPSALQLDFAAGTQVTSAWCEHGYAMTDESQAVMSPLAGDLSAVVKNKKAELAAQWVNLASLTF